MTDDGELESCSVCGAIGYSCSPAMLGSGLRIHRITDPKEVTLMHTLKDRTYVNRDSTAVVPEGSPDAAHLLGIAGDEISDETAKRLGLGTVVPTSASYADMKVPDLRALAAERGVELDGNAKKADIVAALEDADQDAGTADVTSTDAGATTASIDAPDGTTSVETPAGA